MNDLHKADEKACEPLIATMRAVLNEYAPTDTSDTINCMRVDGTGKILGFERQQTVNVSALRSYFQEKQRAEYLSGVASNMQDLCDKQAKMLADRDAVLRQALEALWTSATPKCEEAIAAIKGVLND